MNDHDGNAHLLPDGPGEGCVPLGIFGGTLQAQHLGHVESLALVETEGDIVVGLKFRNDLKSRKQVGLNAFGRVGQVEEHVLPFACFHRLVLGEQLFPNGRHVRQHRPVDHSDEVRRGPKFLDQLVAQPLNDRFPVRVLHGGVLAEHDLAVVELESRGQGRLGERMDLGALGKLFKNRVNLRIAAHPHVFHGRPQGGHGESHQRPVAADLLHGRDYLEVGTLAGRLAHFFGERLDGGVRKVLGGRLALLDHLQDGVEEPVKTEKTGEFEELGAGTDQSLRCLPC